MSRISIACCCCLLTAALSAADDSVSGPDRAFFENRIRPVLVRHCYECHSDTSAELGGKLRLDTRAGILRGGEAGPAIVAGKPEASLVLQAMRHEGLEMPPDGKLSDQVLEDFRQWILKGAPDPRADTDAPAENLTPDDKLQAANLWSLKPVVAADPPVVQTSDWPMGSIDHFALAEMEAASVAPGPDADSRTLVRRLFYDLIGLPPTINEAEEFIEAARTDRQQAIQQLVDHLLSRRQFGEHWGRHWLDIARYAESNGNDGLGRNPTFPHAWRYRDYVIAAFNDDMPYDRFIQEQIAGDLLPAETPQDRDRQLTATGLLAMSAKPAKAMNDNFDMDVVADQIDTIGRGIMGLSVACARCHDHKFDPVPTREYYALAGIFTSSETMWGVAGHEGLTAPSTDLHVLKSIPGELPPDNFVETVILKESDTGKPKKIPKPRWPSGTALAMGIRDRKAPTDTHVHVKGETTKSGEPVPRGFLTAIAVGQASSLEIDATESGRRQLAEWLTARDHPLTARVMVNRIWMHLFGDGLVRTPDDFGVYGDRPTHPELLDHLAHRFVQSGWSTKTLIREIVFSRTYQLDSKGNGQQATTAPTPQLLNQHFRRRLNAEQFRDSVLVVSGQLNPEPAKGSVIRHRDILVNLAGSLHQPSQHRSIYLCYLRNSPPPELAAFDLPDFSAVQSQRAESVVPNQALYLLNSPFILEQLRLFADRMLRESSDVPTMIRRRGEKPFKEYPSDAELIQAVRFLESLNAESGLENAGWIGLCQAVLASNEFRYVD